jgi:membrane-bound serine protease (ClpP class)
MKDGQMNILLDPNVAYLLLVFGAMLAVLAVFSPGTGLLELGALVCLALAGYGVYSNNLPINIWALALLVLGVLPFLVAITRSGNRVFLIIVIPAFVIGSAYFFQSDTWWRPGVNPFLALLVSSMAGGYLWIATNKVLEAERTAPTHDLKSLIGKTGETKTEVRQEGTVQVAGELWTAHSEQPIPADTEVRVTGIEGFVLEVEPLKKAGAS